MIRTRVLILLAFSLGLVSFVTAKTKPDQAKEVFDPEEIAAKSKKKPWR